MMSEITPGLTSEQFALAVDSLRAEISRAVAAEREACKQALDALEATQKIVVDGALTGFNYRNGDWAERLFANQHSIAAAIAAIRARGTQ
jgi:hypothetical protein